MQTIVGYDKLVGEFVAGILPDVNSVEDLGDYTSVGYMEGGQFIAGVIFRKYVGFDIEVTVASTNPRWCTRGRLTELFIYAFIQLGCSRVTSISNRKNKRSRRLLKGLGFKEEGIMRKGMYGREDAVLYGMLKEECKFINGRYLQRAKSARPYGNSASPISGERRCSA